MSDLNEIFDTELDVEKTVNALNELFENAVIPRFKKMTPRDESKIEDLKSLTFDSLSEIKEKMKSAGYDFNDDVEFIVKRICDNVDFRKDQKLKDACYDTMLHVIK